MNRVEVQTTRFNKRFEAIKVSWFALPFEYKRGNAKVQEIGLWSVAIWSSAGNKNGAIQSLDK